MPEGGKYEKLPRPESMDALIKYTSSNPCVSEVIQQSNQILKIIRNKKSEILVHVTNIYIVSETDIEEILLDNSDIDCIVTVSAWNSYTSYAKELAKSKRIGLFKFKEFLGALYYEGDAFVNYLPPERDEKGSKRRFS